LISESAAGSTNLPDMTLLNVNENLTVQHGHISIVIITVFVVSLFIKHPCELAGVNKFREAKRL